MSENTSYSYAITPYNNLGIAGVQIIINASTLSRSWYPTAGATTPGTPTFTINNINYSFILTTQIDYLGEVPTPIQPYYMFDRNLSAHDWWRRYNGVKLAYTGGTPLINGFSGATLRIIASSGFAMSGYRMSGDYGRGPNSFRPKTIVVFGTNDNSTYILLDNSTYSSSNFTIGNFSGSDYWILERIFTNATLYTNYYIMITHGLDLDAIPISEFYWYM